MRKYIQRIPLLPSCLAVLFALSPVLLSHPRLMADDEMDQVCAKGSTGLNVDSVALNQMVFDFSRQTSLGLVSGSGVVTVEVIPNASGKSQIIMAPVITASGSGNTTVGSTAIPIPVTNLQVVNGTVRVTGDLNINMQTLPDVIRALQQNRLVLPSGFNPFVSSMQGVGGTR